MKKTYVIPSIEVVKVNTAAILASSVLPNHGNDNTTGDSWQEGGQLGRDDNPSAPNIWEQGW